MNTILKRVISLVLCFVLVAGFLPTGVLAAETGETVTTEATKVTTEPTQEASPEATEPEVIPVTGITLDRTALEVGVGAEPVTLVATVTPEDATDKNVTWTSSEPGVASVVDGVVTFGYMGEAVITATAGGFSASCTVTVGEGEVVTYANDSTDYIFVATDRHTNTSIIATMINAMESKIGENELDYLALGGDMVGSGSSHPTYNSSTVLSEVTGATSSLSATNVDIVAGIHDMNVNDDAGIVLPYSGGGAQIFEGNKFYVYGVPESCISGAVSGVDPETEANDFVTWANGSDIDKSKAIIVVSHYPLHVRRNDNDGAVYWASALNTVAAGDDAAIDRNVAFFWGHNHTGESSKDTAVYHVAPNGSISVQGGSSSQTIYFTYANAGYLNSHSSATLITITDDTITFDKYKNSSVSTSNSVDRVADPVTLTSIAVTTAPTTVEYTVGDTFTSEGLVVTATYSDGSTEAVTGYTLSAVDMTTAGEQEVTVTYEGMTASFKITVKSAEPTVNTVECWDDTEQVIVEATGLGLTGATATNMFGEYDAFYDVFTDHMAVEVALTGLVEGESVKYSISVVADLDITNLELYYVDEKGELTPVEFKLVTDELNNVYVEFTANYDGTFVYGSPKVPEGYTLASLTLTNVPSDVLQGGSLVLDETAEITATYTMEGAEDFVRKLTIYDYDASNFSGFDVNVAGPQTVIFTFEDVTATHEIFVWGDSVADETSGVTVALDVSGAEYGVTAVTVAESANTHVEAAVANVMSNYVAYDISLVYEDGYAATEDTKTVTLPVPEGVTNPVVYYVSDNGYNVIDMNATVIEDGKTVSFETKHFSTYVVGESSMTGTDTDTTVPGSSVTTYTANEMTVYKLVTTPTSGKQYLIVNSNTDNGYGLDSDTTGYATTVFTGGEGYYSSYDEASQSGTAFAVGSDVYLTTDGAYLWTAGSNSFTIGYTQSSDGDFLSGGTYSYTLNPSGSGDAWTLNGSQLTIKLETSYRGLFDGSSLSEDFYLTNSGSTWSMATSGAANVYFYEPVTIYTLSETTTGTQTATYGMYITYPDNTGTYVDTQQAITANNIIPGETLQLGATFTSTVDGQTPPSGGTWTITSSNPAVATVDNTGLVTFTGTAGETLIQATYSWEQDGVTYSVSNYVAITAVPATDDLYTITMHKQTTDADGNPAAGDQITAPITIKNIQAGMQDSVWAVVKADGTDLGALGDKLTWTLSGDPIGTIDPVTGVVTFNGTEGTGTVTAYYTCPGGRVIQASVTYSVTVGSYTVPEDGTNDFPEYPDPGAIRFDKHATAVGNFSETGIAQVELSMTGVPYGTDQAIDVVVMLDMSTSMDDTRIAATVAATKTFLASIVKDKDGNYTDNRVYVGYFNGDTVYTITDSANIGGELASVDSDAEYEALLSDIESEYDGSKTSSGTNYDVSLEECYNVLNTAKTDGTGDDRQQFCVFMSDGGPTDYATSASNVISESSIVDYFEVGTAGSTTVDPADYTNTVPAEYWSGLMKTNGVTIYSVGLILQEQPSSGPQTYRSYSDDQYYYITKTLLTGISSGEAYFYNCESSTDTTEMEGIFSDIAQSILDAATDVRVEDKIASDYTMVFDAPNATVDAALPTGQEMYIEVKDYVLNPVYGSDGTTIVDHTRGTATSLMKLYLGKNGTTYYAASDAAGTAYATPTFNQTAIGTMYYWTTTATSSGVSVTVDGTTYYFDEAGISNKSEDFVAANWFNMASGAYASGNITTTEIVDETTGATTTNELCNDLIIATPYFVYNASTKMLTWTAAKLSTSELTLSYFVYLDESGGYSGAENESPAGTYETNEYAHLHYTNFQGTDCQQTFPVPQMTWNGAQVSYVFYLVNEAGQPVNRAGKVVPFSEAVYVTDVFTHSIVWNDLEQVASLEASYLAEDLVPSVYQLYDAGASYNIHVFEDEAGQNLNNHFIIGSSSSTYTTYVFNTKADATKYQNPATYAATSTYKCKEYVEGGAYTDDKGAYNIVTKTGATVVETGFDFSNTTVAFAVTWTPGLVADSVVVDYGLDVVIDVIKNDNMAAGVVGVRTTAPSGVTTEGTYDRVEADTLTSVDLYIDANNDEATLKELKIGTASVENLSSVRFSLDETNGMQFTDSVQFYYEADVNYYVDNELKTTSMYSSVTVIPATTIYYEDEFLTLTSFSKTGDSWSEDETSAWTTEGTRVNATQDQDRPGESKISAALDADNNYGYDSAYETMSTHSLGSGAKITVDADTYGTAEFSFYGTGFDVISLTSNATGTITVLVKDASGATVRNTIVDTYYGMEEDGTLSANNPNTIYQVPVIKIFGLPYGQYTVTITAAYNQIFDHADTKGDYDLYLDAIRIYDPTGNQDDTANDAYIADGEAWPVYEELRNNIIAASDVTVTENEDGSLSVTVNGSETGALPGAIFIDCNDENTSIADYVSYGPNNELYLAKNQAIAFTVTDNNIADIQLGIKVANGGSVTYEINGDSYTVNTTTDMYYSILDYAKDGKGVTIKNVSGGILSLTNIKVTHTTAPATEAGISLLSMDAENTGVALMMLRRAPVVEDEVPETTVPEVTEPEETVPETTVPEETEPEETVPETTVPEETEPEETVPETTVPEETEPETEPTEPEATEPEEDASEEVTVEKVVEIVKIIVKKLFGWLFG